METQLLDLAACRGEKQIEAYFSGYRLLLFFYWRIFFLFPRKSPLKSIPFKHLKEMPYPSYVNRHGECLSGQTWPVGPGTELLDQVWTAAGHMVPYACLARIGWLRVIGDLPPSANCNADRKKRSLQISLEDTFPVGLSSVSKSTPTYEDLFFAKNSHHPLQDKKQTVPYVSNHAWLHALLSPYR